MSEEVGEEENPQGSALTRLFQGEVLKLLKQITELLTRNNTILEESNNMMANIREDIGKIRGNSY